MKGKKIDFRHQAIKIKKLIVHQRNANTLLVCLIKEQIQQRDFLILSEHLEGPDAVLERPVNELGLIFVSLRGMKNSPPPIISKKIFFIRGHRVMLDSGLASLYGVETKYLNRSVRRNLNRFPEDFMFQLTEKEAENLRFQIGPSSSNGQSRGGKRYLPLVFTEQGVAMLSSVVRSEHAAMVNIEIMRAFVTLREFLLTNQELARKLSIIERKYDSKFKEVFEAINALIDPVLETPRRRIGIVNEDT